MRKQDESAGAAGLDGFGGEHHRRGRVEGVDEELLLRDLRHASNAALRGQVLFQARR